MPHNRRKFIKNLALATGGVLVTQNHNLASPTNKKLGIALVGLGNYASKQLAPALLQTQWCELRGIVTGTPEKAERWAKEYNIPKANIYNYQNFDTIKDNEGIDVVYVVLPNFLHAEYTIRAAKAGKHVICEKPMAMNVQECKDMISACKEANRQLGIGYRLYFEPHHLEMRRLAQEKVYGQVKMVESSLGFSMADPKIWRLSKEKGGGGAIMDLGVYCIQGARRTIGELPTAVTAQGFILDKHIFKDIYEGMTFQMDFPTGAISNSTTTYSSYVDRLYATTGWQSYWLSPAFNAIGVAGQTYDGQIKNMDIKSPEYQQIAQMDDFASCIINNKKSAASGEEGLIDMQIIEAIKMAANTNAKVEINYQ